MDSGRLTEVPEAIARIRAIGGDDDANLFSADLYLLQGRWQEALADYRSQKYAAWRLIGAAMAEYSLGDASESRRLLEEVIRTYGDSLSYQYAMVCAWRHDADGAFHWLDRGFHVHDGGLIYLKHDRMLASLRSDPRYAALLKSCLLYTSRCV